MADKRAERLNAIARYNRLIQRESGRAVRPFREDGYVNLINRYGTSKDINEHYRFVPEPEFPDDMIEAFYEGNGLFAKIIDMPAEEAIKHGFTLKDIEDIKLNNFCEEALDELDWEETAMTAIKWARLFGGSIIVMLVNDGRGLEEPLDWRHIKSIDDLRVYDRTIIQPDYASMYNYDPQDPFRTRGSRLGMPEYYTVFSQYGTFTVHESRCLTFRNGVLPENAQNSTYQMWGIPEYVRIHRAIRDAEIAHSSAPKLMERSIQPIYKMKDLSMELATEQGEDFLLRRLQAIDMARGAMNSIAIDAEGEDYHFEQFSFTGVNDVLSASCNMLSAVTNIPQVILFGAPVGGLSTADDTAMENYYNYIERIQKRMVRSNLRYLLSVLFQAGVRTGEVDEVPSIKVEFNPLWSMSDLEKAQLDAQKASIEQTRAATAQIYVAIQAIDPSEVRAKLADSDEFDVETMLDEYDDDYLFGPELPEGLEYLSEEDQQKAMQEYGPKEKKNGPHRPMPQEGQGGEGGGQPGGAPPDMGGGDPMAAMMAGMGGAAPSGEEKNTDPGTEGSASTAAPAATKLPQDMSEEEVEKAQESSVEDDEAHEDEDIPDGDEPRSVGVLCVKDGAILTAVRKAGRGKGLIGGPGGHIEMGESPEDAARREAFEEFKIKPKNLIPLGMGTYEPEQKIRPAIFLCTEWEGEPETGDGEMGEPMWMTPRVLDEVKGFLFKPFADSYGKMLYKVGVESRMDEDVPQDEIEGWITSNGTHIPVTKGGDLGGDVGDKVEGSESDGAKRVGALKLRVTKELSNPDNSKKSVQAAAKASLKELKVGDYVKSLGFVYKKVGDNEYSRLSAEGVDDKKEPGDNLIDHLGIYSEPDDIEFFDGEEYEKESAEKERKEKAARPVYSGDEYKLSDETAPQNTGYNYDPDDGLQQFIHKNIQETKPIYKEGGMDAVRDEWLKTRLQACTDSFVETDEEEAQNILRENIRGSTAHNWLMEYNPEAKLPLAAQMTGNSEAHNAALNIMYLNYKDQCKSQGEEPLSFEKFLITPVKMYRGGSGKEQKSALAFSSYTFDKGVAEMFKDCNTGHGNRNAEGVVYEAEIRPIDTFGSITRNGEMEIFVPGFIAPNGNRDSRTDGGPGSGNFGHGGRPGEVGGSSSEGTGASGEHEAVYGHNAGSPLMYDQNRTYRRYSRSGNGMSEWGHAMFADDPESVEGYGGDNGQWFTVNNEKLTDIKTLKDQIIEARHNTELPDYLSDLSDDEFAEMFDPDDIVDSAEAWDNDDLTPWFYENVAEPNDIGGIKTKDGAIVFNEELIEKLESPYQNNDGGPGSGNFGHEGRPGEVGGSGSGGGSRAIVHGSDITSSYKGKTDITSVLKAQGFDGLPKVLDKDEFDKAVKESHFIAQRSVTASSPEILDAYQDALYNGEFYATCATGGASYGQGLYCVSDYNGELTQGIREEMAHYRGMNRERQRIKSVNEYMSKLGPKELGFNGSQEDLDLCMRFFKNFYTGMSKEEHARMKEIRATPGFTDLRNAYNREYDKARLKYLAPEVTETMTIDPSAKIITYDDLIDKQEDYAAAVDTKYEKIDPGAFAAMLGYDAIKAEDRGPSGSYTVILNRTKLILQNNRLKKDAKDGDRITFRTGKDGVIEAIQNGDVIGWVYEADYSSGNNNVDNSEEHGIMEMEGRNQNNDGGPGSGNFNHSGRPGEVGGSGDGGGGNNDITHFSTTGDRMRVTHDFYVKASKSGKTKFTIKAGREIERISCFAGKGSSDNLVVSGRLAKQHGGKARDWSHKLGFALTVDNHGKESMREIHWFEHETIGQLGWKVKFRNGGTS